MELQPSDEDRAARALTTLCEFFSVASDVVLADGLTGLANAVGGYASYQPVPDEVRQPMLLFETALRERAQRDGQQ